MSSFCKRGNAFGWGVEQKWTHLQIVYIETAYLEFVYSKTTVAPPPQYQP